MSRRFTSVLVTAFVLTFVAGPGEALQGQEAPSAPEAMHDVTADDLAFEPIEVPGFLNGMKIAAVHGDPSVAGEPYTLRLAFPDGYEFPPHWHPMAENVTVLEGSFLLAMGRKFDKSELVSYEPGDYLFIAAENPHFGGAKGRTVIQLHGMGPFDIEVVEGQGMSDR